jgi:hypothetical protein
MGEIRSVEEAQAWRAIITMNGRITLRISMKQPFLLAVLPLGWQEVASITDSDKWFKLFVIS